MPALPPLPPPPPPSRARRRVLWTPVLDNVECVDMYKRGGHHPVNLGDVLGQKFKVIHKLGKGGFGLVWLARDLEHHRNVALKVLRADAPSRELSALEHIQTAAINVARIVHLHETFTIRGPNGVHLCLVTNVGGPSLRSLSLSGKRPDLRFLTDASQKLAEGLAALHSAGICHGDLTDSNVLFGIKDFHQWSESQIHQCFGTPTTAPVRLLDGSPAGSYAPAHVVCALDFSCLDVDQLSSDVLIVDFGEAFFESNVPQGLRTPAAFYAPEMVFGYPPSHATDLWALGCLVFQMHTLHILLPAVLGSVLETVSLATETIGALPEDWSDRYQGDANHMQRVPGRSHPWFDHSIRRTRILGSQISKAMPDLSQEQHAEFVELLNSVLIFEPTSRFSAEAVSKHPWFRNK